jgi:hypothetical protein
MTDIHKAEVAALRAEVARLRETLMKIAEFKPSFDYCGCDEFGLNSDIPGSPYDRGKEEASKHLASIARAALSETEAKP